MIEERGEQLPPTSESTGTTSEDMAEALAAAKASSPSLGSALDAARVKPDELADAHERATSDEQEGKGPTAG